MYNEQLEDEILKMKKSSNHQASPFAAREPVSDNQADFMARLPAVHEPAENRGNEFI